MADIKIRVEKKEDEVMEGAKRQYAPVSIFWTCPTCGEEQEEDLTVRYLSYPAIGGLNRHTLYCGECDEAGRETCEFDITLKVELTVEVVDGA